MEQKFKILEDNYIEQLKIIGQDTKTSGLITNKLRSVVTRLLSKSDGQYDIKDFVFVLSDDKDINAFYISPEKTPSKKNIIGVSTGLIESCNNEDELAGVIGHELGHFIYNVIMGNNKNTIFQERGSDLHSLDLMIDGGYNPVAYEQVVTRLQNKYNSILHALDVHGGGYSRLEDVRAYLTYLKKEKGELNHSNKFENAEWGVFKKDFEKNIKNENFQTYLEKKLIEKNGNDKVSSKNFKEFLNLLITEIQQGNILNNEARVIDATAKIISVRPDKYNREENVIKIMQEFVEKLLSVNDNDRVTRIIEAFKYYSFKPFGIYKEHFDTIQKFIDSKTEAEAQKYAKEYFDYKNTFGSKIDENVKEAGKKYLNMLLLVYFGGIPKFTLPAENKAIGKEVPWKKFEKWAQNDVLVERLYKELIPQKVPYDYYVSKDGIIIYTGQKAILQRNLDREKDNTNKQEIEIKQRCDRILEKLDVLNIMADFAENKITADETLNLLGGASGFIKKMELLRDGIFIYNKITNYEKDVLNKIKKSRAYKVFTGPVQRSISDEEMFIYAFGTGSYGSEKITNFYFVKKVSEFLWQLCKQVPVDARIMTFKAFYLRWLPDYLREEYVTRFYEFADLESINALWFSMDFLELSAKKIAGPEENRVLDIILKKYGISYADNEDGLQKNISTLSGYRFKKGMSDLGIRKVATLYLLKELQNGMKIADIRQYFDFLEIDDEDSKTILADAVMKNNGLLINDFNALLEVYNVFEKKQWFSENRSNQVYILNLLLDKIKGMSLVQQEAISADLLTGSFDNYIRESKELKFPNQKNELMKIYVDSVYKQLGKDDATQEYQDKLSNKIRVFNGVIRDRELLSSVDSARLFRLLSDKLVSQDKLSSLLKEYNRKGVSQKDIEKKDIMGRGLEALLEILAKTPQKAKFTIEFLNKRLTNASKQEYINKMNERSSVLNTEKVEILYDSFWAEDLSIRSLIMNKLLNRIVETSDDLQKQKVQIDYVCDMHFPKKDKYRKDAELIFETAIMAFDNYERSLILSAIASADKNKDEQHKNASSSVGSGLRMFFENMGPAWVKFGQLMSYVPNLPSEIREELAKLKDRADIPARWDLYKYIKETLPNELQKNIIAVEEVLGAGSFWITAKIQFMNTKTGLVETKVLSLLRPYAKERSLAGFKTIEKAVKDLANKNSKYKPLLKVAQQAKASAEHEVDVVYGQKQLVKAENLYGDLSVSIDGKLYTPKVANWEYYGEGKNKIGYKLMELAQGKTLDRMNVSVEEKRKMALAYVTIELANLFKGDVWDIDRHMGQQNFNITPDGNCDINIYDTGAQMQNAPGNMDKVLLAEVLYGLIRAARTGKSIDEQILKTIQNMDNLEATFNVDTNYVTDVQKGLMALSDIIEYQKEIKDIDGKVIQKSLRLSSQDLADAIEAVYDSPTTDSVIKMSLAGKVLLNKLRPWRKGWLSSLDEGLKKNSKNPIKIGLKNSDLHTVSVHLDKPQKEIQDLEDERKQQEILGINKKYIKEDENITNATVKTSLQRA